jgi:RNA polymerase sigma-70 factor, ECF subfamily
VPLVRARTWAKGGAGELEIEAGSGRRASVLARRKIRRVCVKKKGVSKVIDARKKSMSRNLSSVGAAPLSFDALFAAHARRVGRALRRLGVREADLEDVRQDVFVVVSRKLPEFRGDSSIETWLHGICLRAASDHRRRAYVRREAPASDAPERAIEPAQEDAVAQREARAALARLLAELDEHKRAAFVLFELAELPIAEVACRLGCPAQTAYSRLYAARRDLERRLVACGPQSEASPTSPPAPPPPGRALGSNPLPGRAPGPNPPPLRGQAPAGVPLVTGDG